MFEPSSSQKQQLQKICICLVGCFSSWLVLLINTAYSLHNINHSQTTVIKIGPLTLNTITKTVVNTGFRLRIGFDVGFIVWLVFGILAGYLWSILGSSKLPALIRRSLK